MVEYIAKNLAIELMHQSSYLSDGDLLEVNGNLAKAKIEAEPAADVVPYSIDPDGTLTITVPKGTYKKINRVLVEEDGTHWGGLYYAD